MGHTNRVFVHCILFQHSSKLVGILKIILVSIIYKQRIKILCLSGPVIQVIIIINLLYLYFRFNTVIILNFHIYCIGYKDASGNVRLIIMEIIQPKDVNLVM